ncbi:MAG: F0F1 ATP synthase subunit delta [bacterium]|nr:F0F1 ATP synthase subunit delta [bacterium]
MKYSINNYVGAFIQVARTSSNEKVVEGFVKLLKKTGDIKNAKKILEAVHKKLVNEKGRKWVNIETAREISGAKTMSLKHKFSKKDLVDFKINSELVSGVRITVDGERELNNSLQNKLNKLFK